MLRWGFVQLDPKPRVRDGQLGEKKKKEFIDKLKQATGISMPSPITENLFSMRQPEWVILLALSSVTLRDRAVSCLASRSIVLVSLHGIALLQVPLPCSPCQNATRSVNKDLLCECRGGYTTVAAPNTIKLVSISLLVFALSARRCFLAIIHAVTLE